MTPNEARAESRPSTNNVYGYINSFATPLFNRAGGVFLPLQVISALRQGNVSLISLFVLANNIMNKAVEQVLSQTPDIRDPYVVAKARFEWGICFLQKQFQQGTLILLLPQLSSNSRFGGSGDEQDRQAAQQQGAMLAQAFGKSGGCDGSGNNGLDPQLVAAFAGN